jgi:hypothetical protein
VFPAALLVSLQYVSVINTAKNQSVHNDATRLKPREEFAYNRKVITNDVMTDKTGRILKKLYALRNRLLRPLIVKHKGLLSVEVIDTKTVDRGNSIVESVGFAIKNQVH